MSDEFKVITAFVGALMIMIFIYLLFALCFGVNPQEWDCRDCRGGFIALELILPVTAFCIVLTILVQSFKK